MHAFLNYPFCVLQGGAVDTVSKGETVVAVPGMVGNKHLTGKLMQRLSVLLQCSHWCGPPAAVQLAMMMPGAADRDVCCRVCAQRLVRFISVFLDWPGCLTQGVTLP